jgi:hypothetical protein
MRPRTAFPLLLAGALVAGAGWYFGPHQLPSATENAAAGNLMFPDLTARLQNAAEIDITHQGKTLIIRRQGNVWGLADRSGYPVESSKLHSMFAALTELRLAEPRTANPANYARLGVEDPNAKNATSNLLRVSDSRGQAIVQLIVGHSRVLTQGNVPDEVYVRRPNEAQSWLAYGSLKLDPDSTLWIDHNLLNIDPSKVTQITIDRDGAKLVFTGKDGKLTLTDPAQHPKLADYKLDQLASGLQQFTCEDVRPGPAPSSGATGDAVFTTTDGLRVTVHLYKPDKDMLARFDVTGVGPAKTEAAKMASRLAGWNYQIGSWKESELVPTLAGLEETPPAKPATSGATN